MAARPFRDNELRLFLLLLKGILVILSQIHASTSSARFAVEPSDSELPMPPIVLECDYPIGVSDFTLFAPIADTATIRPGLKIKAIVESDWPGLAKKGQAESEVILTNNAHTRNPTGRCLACRCFDGNTVSISIRRSIGSAEKRDAVGDSYSQPIPNRIPAWKMGPGWFGRHDGDWRNRSSAPIFRTGFWDDSKGADLFPDVILSELVCRLLARQFFQNVENREEDAKGLIVIAGETGSFKSTVIRGILALYLAACVEGNVRRKAKDQRRPHLITFEDPIEQLLWHKPPAKWGEHVVDYTPRTWNSVTQSPPLSQVTSAALRQKPAALYVGEVRDRKQWEEVLHFAGTGHLVLTTTHAGSLVETMAKIFAAVEADSPAIRGQFAGRICGVVHLKTLKSDSQRVSAPAVWIGSPASQAALVTDGLASILPYQGKSNGPRDKKDPPFDDRSIGRYPNLRWIIEELSPPPLQSNVADDLLKQALNLDLRGE